MKDPFNKKSKSPEDSRQGKVSLPVTLLPNVPEHILGIFNRRGNIISITDLKKVFGLPTHDAQRMRQEA